MVPAPRETMTQTMSTLGLPEWAGSLVTRLCAPDHFPGKQSRREESRAGNLWTPSEAESANTSAGQGPGALRWYSHRWLRLDLPPPKPSLADSNVPEARHSK